MVLFAYIGKIQKEKAAMAKEFGSRRFDCALAFFNMDLTVGQMLTPSTWTKVWSTYSLYDPLYADPTSFGFWVDSGNGITTILPSLLFTLNMSVPLVAPRTLGCIGLASFWQEFYGTAVYFSTFFANKRHVGKGLLEIFLFVGVSNGLWFLFPLLGMHASYQMIESGTFAVFGWAGA